METTPPNPQRPTNPAQAGEAPAPGEGGVSTETPTSEEARMIETKMERYERRYGKATYGIVERVATLTAVLATRVELTKRAAERPMTPSAKAQYELALSIETAVRDELADARAALIEVRAAADEIGVVI
jgi:hypothetical protein